MYKANDSSLGGVKPVIKAIVLLSGGMDSATCASMAIKEHGAEHVMGLSLFYGQKHAAELNAAKAVAEHFGLVKYVVLNLPDIFTGAGSTLTDADKETPSVSYEELQSSYGVSPTYVPFRNGNLLSTAAALALREGAEYIYYGAHSEDAKNWAYPDCTPEFNGAMANAIYIGTYRQVRVVTPLQWLTKAEIAERAFALKTPLELTYSCYRGGDKACGTCPTCVGRIEAFKQIGAIDPIAYEIEIEWGTN